MADFVAVIRRAVDGLATNTPETRAKVYEKARGAVQRQLENMKPRPPEEMLRRQLDKLDLAIQEVESEHREAADDQLAAAPVDAPVEPQPPVVDETPAYEEPVREEPVHQAAEVEEAVAAAAPAPEHHDDIHDHHAEHHVAPVHEEAPVEPEYVEPYHAEPAVQDEHEVERHHAAEPAAQPPIWDEVAEPEQHEATERHAEDARPPVPSFFDQIPHRDEPQADAHHADADGHQHGDHGFPHDQRAHDLHDQHPHADHVEHDDAGDRGWPPQTQPVEPAHVFEGASWQNEHHALPQDGGHAAVASERDPFADDDHRSVDAAWNDVPELTVAGPVEPVHVPASGHADAHFDHETHVVATSVQMPAVAEFAEAEPVRDERTPAAADPFAEFLSAEAKAAPSAGKPDERDPWNDLEDLIGYNKDQPAQTPEESRAAMAAREEDELADLMARPAKPYRVAPARKRNYAGMILGAVGVVVLAGGAYALWVNRDSIDDMIGGFMASGSSGSQQTAQTTPAKPANGSSNASTSATTPAQQTAAAASKPADAKPAVSADGSVTNPKFTQQLMPDGSEVDRGPGNAGSLAQNAEGQSVAQLNAPPATPAANPSAPNTPPASGTPTPSATPAQVPAASGEKMFLYEERIGQTAPTAIDGTVSWSLKREAGSNGGPPEAEVQGRISVPGRGLTALVTVKRNSDPSLPASHLIEIVFSVPKEFEGGAIDSVQRIAMKQTEQDRGNALIAVPAKITDDFHMIALNDFPDARKTNLDLLKTRNWIDIPVAYRNGRRALLTLQKGPEGEKAFNDAINEWATLPASPNGQ